MTTAELALILKAYPSIKNNIICLNKRISELSKLKYDLVGPATSNLSGTTRGSDISDPTHQAVVRLTETYDKDIAEMTREIGEYLTAAHDVDLLMMKLMHEDPTEHKIIECYYFKDMGWRLTADKVGYCMNHTKQYHYKAMEKAVKFWMT